MKNSSQKDEWSLEPVPFAAPDSSMAGLRLLLQTVDQHLLALQTKLSATPDAPEQTIR
jgi:hypothetical protein